MENKVAQYPTKKSRNEAIKAARIKTPSIEIKETEYDEYRVNFVAGREATAYYTSDLKDAIGTARLMEAFGCKGGR